MPSVVYRTTWVIAAAMVLFPIAAARAQTLSANGVADFDFVVPSSNQDSFNKGGLGKLEFGGGNVSPLVGGQALADLRARFNPSFDAMTTLRFSPDQHAPFDVLEAYARYQPIQSNNWVWSMKGGAFFPPISLENEAIGWTSPWTLTSSAINSWIGDELRTIGVEPSVTWRLNGGSLGLIGAAFGANEPAGAALASRGWVFDSRPTGLFGEPRMPDLLAAEEGLSPPLREQPFKQIDDRVGWYAGVSGRADGIGRLAALYYDNRANPTKESGDDYAWHTRFASLGGELDIGDVVLLSQAMTGQTTIAPALDFASTTDFQSAYVLAGYYIGDYRLAGRVDVFATQQHNSPGGSGAGERGFALTAAATWAPKRWLHLTAEILRVESDRGERLLLGLPAHASEMQGRLTARLLY